MFTNSYLIALGIPIMLLLSGAVARKLVRGSGWKVKDFYLGVETALAALGAALIHFFDLHKQQLSGVTLGDQIASTASFLAIAFFLLLWILSTHQDWEARTQNEKGQMFWLGGVSNVVGILLFGSFVMLVKGI
jgi:NADH:ubiquinone oxidoreductase subunit 2 (subunit N)